MDHDQRFKILLTEFFEEFVRLFFPAWAERFDFTNVQWLQNEAFLDPPQGERRNLDLVAKLPVREALLKGDQQSWVALLHVEVESKESATSISPRMFEYFWLLRTRHNLPVLPIVLFLNVGLEGVGWNAFQEWFWEHRLVHFEYAYVGLPALDAEAYLKGDNWLGVALAALMKVPDERRALLKAEAIRRLFSCPENEARRYLLCEVVDRYLPLQGSQAAEFDKLWQTERYEEVRKMGTTFFSTGFEQGQRRILFMQLEKRFGALNPRARARLESWPIERLEELSLRLFDAQSLEELGLDGPDVKSNN